MMKMKKFYLSVIITTFVNVVFSQSFFEPTTYRGAFAPSPTAQWTDQWTNWDPQNTNYGTSNVNINSNITNNTTWTSNNIYLLQGQIFIKNGATLTIQPGTIIMGDVNTSGSGLFVTQGAKIIAAGTVNQPIIFTSNQPAGQRSAGDWGGIILMGRSANNNIGGIANIEGLAVTADTQFGGGTNPDLNDNSGKLQYVRIEFSGYIYQPNKEINGLTLGSVGKGTTIDHVQVSFGNDDAFEWFGGNVNCRYLVSYRNLDDDFDTDNGYSGYVQFGLVVRDPDIADNPSVSTSEGFESDNDAAGSSNSPQTSAIFSNITLVGPYRGNLASTIAAGYRRGARIRRNSGLKIYNSIFTDFGRGIHIDGAACEGNANNGIIKFKNNLIAGTLTGKITEVNSGSSFIAPTWFGNNQNDSLISIVGILVNPYNYTNGDYRPVNSNSPALTNFAYNDPGIEPHVIDAPTVTPSFEYCLGENATLLSATGNSDCTLRWYEQATGGTEIPTPTPATNLSGDFNYYVAQVNPEGIEGPRSVITVTVHSNPPAPSISANGSTSLCTGSTVVLSSSASNGNVWSTSDTTQDITIGISGNYFVTYTDENGCHTTSNTISVNVSNAPVPTIQSQGSLDICEGSSIVLTASPSDTYLWSNNDTTQSITVSEAGSYTVMTTNTDACNGVGTSAPIEVTVTLQPISNFTVSITNGYTVSFTNTSVNAISMAWDFGDFSSSSALNPIHIYPNSDTYTVTLVASNGACLDSSTFVLANLSILEANKVNINELNIFPNPITETGRLTFSISELSSVNILIVDYNGKVVSEVVNDQLEKGNYDFEISSLNLENGMYYVIVRTSNTNKITKINVIK